MNGDEREPTDPTDQTPTGQIPTDQTPSETVSAIDRDIAALLSDPMLWHEPSDQLESRVVAAITSERDVVVPITKDHRPWRGRVASGLIGAAAAAALVFVMTPRDDPPASAAQIELTGTELASSVSGGAEIYRVDSGVAIDFSVPGLPRREGGDFYQGWLKNCSGTLLVPIGSFHDLTDATGWAGVDIDDFPVLTVTRETAAAPMDVAQGSSGEVVVSGSLTPCTD